MSKYIFCLFVFLLFSANNAFAEKIKVEGYGLDSELAMVSAKRNAIAKLSGEFVDSKEVLRREAVTRELRSVTYGVVKDYEILEKYDPETRKVVILADVDKNNAFFRDKEKGNKIKLKKETIREMSQAVVDRVNAVKDLFKDLNEIYDVRVEKVEMGLPNGQNYTYFVEVSIETKESWLNKRQELEKVIGNFDHMVSLNRGCHISAFNFRLVDEKNEIRIKPVQFKFEKNEDGVILGNKNRYETSFMISTPREIEEFSFKLILFESDSFHRLQCFIAPVE